MSRSTLPKDTVRHGLAALAAGVCILLSWFTTAPRADGGEGRDARPALGQCASPAGTLILCAGPGKPCRALKPREAVRDGDLLVALPGLSAEVEAAGGAARLTLLGSLPQGADDLPRPSAVRLHHNRQVPLDFTLETGRVLLTR